MLQEAESEPRNPNHPPPGSTIKVEPIRTIQAVKKIKSLLESNPRNFCLFVVGINTSFRASELLSIRIGQVKYLAPGDRLEVKQPKTKKYRSVTLNQPAFEAIRRLLSAKDKEALKKRDASIADDESFVFTGQRGSGALRVSTLNNLVKNWCKNANLKGNYGSHTLRKTWGYMQRIKQDTPVPLLMRALGHATQRQTMEYLCIQEKEIVDVYTALEL